MKSQTFSAERIVQSAATALERELGGTEDKIPEGFRTSSEWANIWNRGVSSAKSVISEHLKSGRMESKQFMQKKSNGALAHVPFYRAVK